MTIEPTVVVIRQKQGPDVVGICVTVKLNETGAGSYLIEHPYVPLVDHDTGSLTLIPYCPLSDQTIYEFPLVDTKFMTPAKEELASEYMAGLSRKLTVTVIDEEKEKAQKIAFRNALETLSLSPTTETIQ